MRYRRNRDKQIKKAKLTSSAADKRGLGGAGHAPLCVALVPAHSGIDLTHTLQLLQKQGEVQATSGNSFYLMSNRLKKR